MTGAFVRAARRGTQQQVEHVSVVRAEAARGRVAEVYAQVERDFGVLAPPVILHSPAPDALAAAWVMLRETLIATGKAGRAAKEAVAAAVSHGNTCPYCVDVHGTMLHGLVQGGDATAVAGGRFEAIADPHLRAVAGWARDCGTAAGASPPFPAAQGPELAGVAVVFHYYNRMVNVFLGTSPFPPGTPARLRGGLMRLAGRVMRPAATRHRAPGESLGLLPPAPLPADLAWAAGTPAVAEALARSAAAIERGGERSVPAAVRALVETALAGWDGRPPGLSRAWAADALSVLPRRELPAGRLALLTAMASYQVDRPAVEDFRRDGAGDVALVELTSWAAMAAARRVGGRLTPAEGTKHEERRQPGGGGDTLDLPIDAG
ncbi:alkyl hydroperoxide reductase AhpD [Microtetraspora sp. NBRC 13810]|uniref:carboxymuconolactone decarboxylase family protein n=1 Tax=Microtetraspora sp. NBRC 13810 TaxID=3030990 RepID=UPI0024A0DACC|nr:carboxymuconolactone decarboxylase family protein [Microtetraspora sp. NBRC 13810]GLW05802.1 alkyl hydroperoxide reductase AhpD [Microtetraspora sp. NBRC 13810]